MGLDVESSAVEGNGRTHTKDVNLHQFLGPADEQQQLGQWDNAGNDSDPKARSIEEEFEKVPIPPWREQITVRSLVVAAIIGGFFSIITHKLSLTVGVIPSLNVSSGLLGFFFMKVWTGLLSKMGIWSKPFTRQENTVIQTCAVACFGLAFTGGYGTYILGLSSQAYEQVGASNPKNTATDVKQPALGWLFALIFTTGLLGIMVIVPLRKVMILKYKLTYPSGTATALLINSFHTPDGAVAAKKQVSSLMSTGGLSFFFSFFKWFFSGNGSGDCGFDTFPSLGLKAYQNKFYFDFNMTLVGAGMICPHIVNISILVGGILSYGILWPLIKNREGEWYPRGLKSTSFEGLYGYKVFLAIAIILGDGLYQFAKTLLVSGRAIYKHHTQPHMLPQTVVPIDAADSLSVDEQKRTESFLKDRIPTWMAASCYAGLAAIAIGVVPQILPAVKWYYVLLCYLFAPVLAFCNSYGMGLTDWSLVTTYGKLFLFIFAAWSGSDGGVVAGLGTCGMIVTIVGAASDLMQDFKTGYLTRSSPRSMFVSQLIGALMGCFLAPTTFWLFWKAFPIGNPNGQYKAPYGVIYRQMALIGVEGFSALPAHCLQLSYALFFGAVLVNIVRDFLPKKYARFVPLPMAMGIPFYLGPYLAIDMFIGTCIVFVWQRMNKRQSELHVPAVASGLICGDGLWTVISAVLSLAKVVPPLCMMFYPSRLAEVIQDKFPA